MATRTFQKKIELKVPREWTDDVAKGDVPGESAADVTSRNAREKPSASLMINSHTVTDKCFARGLCDEATVDASP